MTASATAALAWLSLGAGHGRQDRRCDAGPVEQGECAVVAGTGVKYLGRAKGRERHDVRRGTSSAQRIPATAASSSGSA
jgi:hypothetical protein